MTEIATQPLTRKDFVSNQEVRWCPGCGDYAILAQIQKIFPTLGVKKENFAVFSGIGCSSRFPYYMESYGFHGIHGRAPALASGAKLANPELSVWVITGDGDAMSIGGNHFIHVLRRNIDMNIVMFNNRIYGLTKGQYSPTSELGKVTKSSPVGSLDYPFNPPQLALGSGGTFIARTLDKEQKHMASMFTKSHEHKGTSFVEVYQNCVIFNDGAFSDLSDRTIKAETQLFMEHDKPLLFGDNLTKGLKLVGSQFEVVEIGNNSSIDDIVVHDETDKNLAMLLSEITYHPGLPTPLGVFYREDKPSYDTMMTEQINNAIDKKGKGNMHELFTATNSWTVE